MHFTNTALLGLLAGCATAATTKACSSPASHKLRSVLQSSRQEDVAARAARETVQIKTYAHVIGASDKVEDGYITDNTVQGQIDLLNEKYNPHNFAFNLVNISRTINASWAEPEPSPGSPDSQVDLMRALRKGSYKDLNLFFIKNMVPNGKCELPIPNPTSQNITNDGCLLRPNDDSGAHPAFDFVTVHEVGHWLGLDHTFENGCKEPGDGVDDTPAEASPVGGNKCPEKNRDTCPDQPGLDPVDNFMTYVGFDCGPQRFTEGQAKRMHKLWTEIRA